MCHQKSARASGHTYFKEGCPENESFEVIPPLIEADLRRGEAAMGIPSAKRICLQGKCGIHSVYFGQDGSVPT